MARDNYTLKETITIVELIADKAREIESKETTTASNNARNLAWDYVKTKFNLAHPETGRNLISIKNRWQKTKKDGKSYYVRKKEDRNLTGGGASNFERDDLMEKVCVLLPGQLSPPSSKFDDDRFLSTTSSSGENPGSDKSEVEYIGTPSPAAFTELPSQQTNSDDYSTSSKHCPELLSPKRQLTSERSTTPVKRSRDKSSCSSQSSDAIYKQVLRAKMEVLEDQKFMIACQTKAAKEQLLYWQNKNKEFLPAPPLASNSYLLSTPGLMMPNGNMRSYSDSLAPNFNASGSGFLMGSNPNLQSVNSARCLDTSVAWHSAMMRNGAMNPVAYATPSKSVMEDGTAGYTFSPITPAAVYPEQNDSA